MNLSEILDLVISLLEQEQKEASGASAHNDISSPGKFIGHRANIEAATKLTGQIPVTDSISIISDIVGICSKLHESTPQDERLREIQYELINFLSAEEGVGICRNENSAPAYLTEEKARGIILSPGELKALCGKSLLKSLLAGVVSPYSKPIIDTIITNSGGLRNRTGLLLVVIDQRTISSSPDMSHTFDLLAQAGIPKPSECQLARLLTDDRPRSGSNANKLALSFSREIDDHSLVSYILHYNYSGSDRATKRGILEEQNKLKKSLLSPAENVDDFINRTRCLIEVNDDELLAKFLKTNAPTYIGQVADHASILKLAIDQKLIRTFDILTEAGFDVLKKPAGTINPFALACEEQGEVLEEYLNSIGRNFTKEKVRAVVTADNNAAVAHAIRGRGYVDVLTLLEKNGASFAVNHLTNLQTAARKNHAGIFDALLREASDEEVGLIISHLDSQGIETSYVIDCVLFDHLRNKDSEDAKSLTQRISEKESTLEENDFFKICQFNGGVTLKYFLEYMSQTHGYDIREHINDADADDKTPLYHAIVGNAYNSLVTELLEHGANPNLIAPNLDAATLAVRNKESGTLKLLVESGTLEPESIESAYREMKKGADNTLVTRAFLKGLREENLRELEPEIQLGLLDAALEKPELKHCLAKFNSIGRGVKIGDFLMSLITGSKVEKVQKLFEEIDVKLLINQELQAPSRHVFEFAAAAQDARESTPLIPNGRVESGYGSRLDSPVDAKYMRNALNLFRKSGSTDDGLIVRTLLDKGFGEDAPKKELKELGFVKKDCSDYCAIM